MRSLSLKIPTKVLVILPSVFDARKVTKVSSEVPAQLPGCASIFRPQYIKQITKIETAAVGQVCNPNLNLLPQLFKHWLPYSSPLWNA